LSAVNEVPPIQGAEATARGDVRITMDVVRDASGAITSGTATFVINLSGFPAGTNATAAHIHEAAPGIAGGVKIGLPVTATSPIAMANGAATNVTFSGINIDTTQGGLAAVNAMLNNPNGFYFNVHTTSNPGGAVRGQLVRQN
jgi:nitric oxide reductase large subunit